MKPTALAAPEAYINRESSWLDFNHRVLEEAEDESNPLLERLKFLAISAGNLDEFFEVRVAGLLQKIEEGRSETSLGGLSLHEQQALIAHKTHEFVAEQNRFWNRKLRPALAAAGIRILRLDELEKRARDFVRDYCEREVDPLLTPVTVDPAHLFPRVINKALCLAFLLRRKRSRSESVGVVTVPRVLPRLVKLPSEGGREDYIFLADLVAHHASTMYRGYHILSAAAFRVTRNSNLYLEEEETRSILESVTEELHRRHRGDAVRLEIDSGASGGLISRLRDEFELDEWQVFRTDAPVNLSRLMNIYERSQRTDLKYRSYTPRQSELGPGSRDLFDEIRSRDILLHHPYDSYDPVVALILAAAEDPRVKLIKLTLYRTSSQSAIMKALTEAARQKEVTVVVELKARFDEASNIRWARQLEEAGVQVFYGVVGLKSHCKLALLVRHDPDGVTRRYAHLGTGNYNPVTARYYTDLSLLTADEEITAAVHNTFNYLTAYTARADTHPLMVAPLDLAQRMTELIAREARHARRGRPARIVAKMNALVDPGIIRDLYKASRAGVEIELIVRGMCALRPGVAGLSDRIRVRSIVGRFLEHSRIFIFANDGNEEVWTGSADWMPRNLYERVEVVFPVKDAALKRRLTDEILGTYLRDNVKARLLQPDGTWIHTRKQPRRRVGATGPGSLVPVCNAQETLLRLAESKPPVSQQTQAATLPTPALERVK